MVGPGRICPFCGSAKWTELLVCPACGSDEPEERNPETGKFTEEIPPCDHPFHTPTAPDPQERFGKHLAPRGPTVNPLIYRLIEEIGRQDEKHGPYEGTILGRSRLALATLEDEVGEALETWRSERTALSWDATRDEVLQVAAVAIRALRDAL